MKTSVITLHTVKNYGSVLQTYATQKEFERAGSPVEFVDYWRKDNLDDGLLRRIVTGSSFWGKDPLRRAIFTAIKFPSIRRQIHVFNGFLKRYIHLSPRRYLSIEELKKDPPTADLYCTGSDQVWNSDWNAGIEKPYFLEYVPEGGKCIAYAASFGKEELTHEEMETIRPFLRKYSSIAMREQSGVRILDEMGFPGNIQIADPTLILEADEWKKLMSGRKIRQSYLLVYQLNKNWAFDAYAQRLAKKMGLKLVRLAYDYHHIFKKGHLVCCPQVEEWISLFYYADFVLTDSFHGTAFSINFNRQFAVIYPQKFSGRLSSLLKLTDLESRAVKDFNDLSVAEQRIDYDPVNRFLSEERIRANRFLKETLAL